MIFERVFKGNKISAGAYTSFRDNIETKINHTSIGENCCFFGFGYIFECCSFSDTPRFDSSYNTFVDCTYLGQDMCNGTPVCVTNFQIDDTNGDSQKYILILIRMAGDSQDIVYIWNNTQNIVIRSYEDFPASWNLHWKRGCLKTYIKAMKKNFNEIS